MINDYEIGKRIQDYRKSRKLTQKALAEKIGVSTNFIGLIEKGIKRPSFKTFVDIVDVLQASPGVIIFGESYKDPSIKK